MSIELKMPALSPTMEKGTLARWLVKKGDMVKPGDLIAEIETDKATMELEAIDEGTITSLMVPEGTDDVSVGTVIALIAEVGEAVAPKVLELADGAPASVTPEPAAPPPPPAAKDAAPIPGPAPGHVAKFDNSDVNATPLARRIATAKGLSLLGITGTGARGRIVKSDISLPSLLAPLPAPASTPVAASRVADPTYDPPAGVPVETIKLTTMRKTIARRLSESKQTVPHFYLTARCNLDALLRLRGELNTSLATRGVKLSVNDLVIKAMAVAIEGGLITPVIRDAGALSLSAIARASKALALKARDGKLVPEDYQGGTASISNLGMFGIDEMFAVINPPQALILGIGSGIEQPWKIGSEIALATIMAATASFDHRAIDGASAAQFMAALRDLIEAPLQIVT
jgi:pyruvate dehydrogenase E2 component (dihydrolipoamide acetyltransferase)